MSLGWFSGDAFELLGDRRHRPVALGAGHATHRVLGGDQPPFGVEGESIGAVARNAERGDLVVICQLVDHPGRQ